MLLRVNVRVQGKLGHADDAVHGRSDLMTHIRQELGLSPCRRFGRLLGLLQFAQGGLQPVQGGLAGLELSRVAHGRTDQPGHQLQGMHVYGAEGIEFRGEDLEDADHLAGIEERHDDHRARPDPAALGKVHARVPLGIIALQKLPRPNALAREGMGHWRPQADIGGGAARGSPVDHLLRLSQLDDGPRGMGQVHGPGDDQVQHGGHVQGGCGNVALGGDDGAEAVGILAQGFLSTRPLGHLGFEVGDAPVHEHGEVAFLIGQLLLGAGALADDSPDHAQAPDQEDRQQQGGQGMRVRAGQQGGVGQPQAPAEAMPKVMADGERALGGDQGQGGGQQQPRLPVPVAAVQTDGEDHSGDLTGQGQPQDEQCRHSPRPFPRSLAPVLDGIRDLALITFILGGFRGNVKAGRRILPKRAHRPCSRGGRHPMTPPRFPGRRGLLAFWPRPCKPACLA